MRLSFAFRAIKWFIMNQPTLSEKGYGVLYYIGGDRGPIKIGFTRDLDARLKRLQMNSPVRLRVLAAVFATRDDEVETHRVFKKWRVHGEWFKRDIVMYHVKFWQKRTPVGRRVAGTPVQ